MTTQSDSQDVRCSNCGASISPGQKFCPNCGKALGEVAQTVKTAPPEQPKKKKRNTLLIVLGGLVGLCMCISLIVFVSGGGEETGTVAQPPAKATEITSAGPTEAIAQKQEPTRTEAPAPTAAPTETAVPVPPEVKYAIGEDVTVGQVRWKMLSAVNEGDTLKSGNQFIDDKTTAGKWIRVRFEIENLSKDLLSYTSINLIDDRGREFVASSDVFSFIDEKEECFLIVNLNPNVPVICQEIFAVPADATGLMAKVGDLKLFGTDQALIDLGLEE